MARQDGDGGLIRITVEPFGSAGYEEMVALRDAVLRRPLGLRLDRDGLDDERHDIHLALRRDDALVGTLILRPGPSDDEPTRFRQMAIVAAHRGTGLGRHLLAEGERRALEGGVSTGVLHARLVSRPFYAKAGWQSEGGTFVEVTLPHVRMTKRFLPSLR